MLRRLTALLAVLVVRGAIAADDLPGWLDTTRSLSLAEEGVRIKGKEVTLGHLTLSISEGVAVPLLGKGGLPFGVYFEGTAGWRYTVSDPGKLEGLRASVERAGKGLRVTGNDVGDVAPKLVLLFTEPLWREMWEPAAGEPAPVPAGAREASAEILERIGHTHPELDFRVAQARLNGQGRFLYADFNGGIERAGYVYDDLRDGRERLFNFRNVGGFHFSQTLASQELSAWTAERRGWIVLEHADIDIATEDNKRGTIVSDLRLRVGEGTRVLPLDLSSTFDPDAKEWSSPKYRLEVKRVLDEAGKDLPFAHKYHELLVEVPRQAAAGSIVKVRVETEGEVFLDMNGRHDDSYFIFQQNGWLPQPSSWMNSRMSYTLAVKTKKPWRAVTSGQQVAVLDDGPWSVVKAKSDRASSILAVLGGKYVTKSATVDGRAYHAHGYATARKDVLENMPKLTSAFVQFYTGLLGEMPEKELDVVEVPEYGFGISPAGVVLITTEAYRAREDDVAKYLSRGINSRLAHEVAHQWFGHKAVDADPSEQWLSESFAEYWSGLAMGALASSASSVAGFPRMLAEWRADNKLCQDVAPISAANALGGSGAFMERRCLLYMRGPLVLHMLRTMIGNDRFAAATKLYLERANMGPATTRDFAKAVSETVGQDMGWYFDQWIQHTGTPIVEVDHKLAPGANGSYRLFGTMRQTAGPGGFKKLMVPLVYELGGKTQGKVVFLDQPEKTFEFVLEGKPASVKVDPFQNNLAVYR
jgi:peptidase M1-like protein